MIISNLISKIAQITAKNVTAQNAAKSADGSLWDYITDIFTTPAPAATGCSLDQGHNDQVPPGVHFYLTGEARNDWGKAADQVLRQYCGIAEPTAEQVNATRQALVTANVDHLDNGVNGVITYDSNSPVGVDHRLLLFLYNDTEIFLPQTSSPAICPAPPATTTPTPVPVPVPAPAVPAEQPPVVPPPQPQVDANAPDITPPAEDVVQAPAAVEAGTEMAEAKKQLEQAIGRATSVIRDLESTNDDQMRARAGTLRQARNQAQSAREATELQAVQDATQALNSARTSAKRALDAYLRNL
ncbi:MAG: hypothetical protein WC529_02365 [Candidatus Margulisiibacteriota bacterium]